MWISEGRQEMFTLESADAFCFHSPYTKLVQKSLARLMLNDFLRDMYPATSEKYAGLEAFPWVYSKIWF